MGKSNDAIYNESYNRKRPVAVCQPGALCMTRHPEKGPPEGGQGSRVNSMQLKIESLGV